MASLPIKTIINWLFPIKKIKTSSTIKAGSSMTTFICIHLLHFLIGYGGCILAQRLFYYEDPTLNYLAIGVLALGYFWSFLKKLNPAGNIAPFIVGILTFFSSHYLWFFPLISLCIILLINHVTMGIFLSLLTCYAGLILFDISEAFIIINTMLIILFILRKNNSLIDFFSSTPKTLLQRFKTRNTFHQK
tara:strand:+ start:10468 stop:11037 length:570 start_codon:yes stop_codon:yes gene_type:complete